MMYKEVEVGLRSFLTWAVGGQASGLFYAVVAESRQRNALTVSMMRCRTGLGLSLQCKCVPQSRTEPPDVQPVAVETMSELPLLTSCNRHPIAQSATSHCAN